MKPLNPAPQLPPSGTDRPAPATAQTSALAELADVGMKALAEQFPASVQVARQRLVASRPMADLPSVSEPAHVFVVLP